MKNRMIGTGSGPDRTGRRGSASRPVLEQTDLPVTAITLEVGSSSNRVLARVFLEHLRLGPSGYRRADRDPIRAITMH